MRLLVAFVGACVLLAGVAAWHLWPARVSPAPPVLFASVRPAATQPVSAANPPLVSDDQPDDTLVRDPETMLPATDVPQINWPQEPTERDALRRLEQARAVLATDPDHETALRDELSALASLGRWHEGARTLQRLCRLHPEDIDLRFDHAAALLRAGRAVEAIEPLREVVRRQPEHAHAWFNLAVAHQALGHLHDARHAWDRAIALRPTTEAYAQRGIVLLDLREWAAAAADFETVLVRQPQADDATLNLSLALWRLGRHDEARRHLRDLLDRLPQHVPALNRLAAIDWELSQINPDAHAALRAEAIECWRRSLEADPHQPEVRELLAQATR